MFSRDPDEGALLLIEGHEVDGENFIYFSSPITEHTARMNILSDCIVVEHNVEEAESAVFELNERKEAILFVESLFILFRDD